MLMTPVVENVTEAYRSVAAPFIKAGEIFDDFLDRCFNAIMAGRNSPEADRRAREMLEGDGVHVRKSVWMSLSGQRPQVEAAFSAMLHETLKGQCDANGIGMPDLGAANYAGSFEKDGAGACVLAAGMPRGDALAIAAALGFRDAAESAGSGEWLPLGLRMSISEDENGAGEKLTRIDFSVAVGESGMRRVATHAAEGWPAPKLIDESAALAMAANRNLDGLGQDRVMARGMCAAMTWRMKGIVREISMMTPVKAAIGGAAAAAVAPLLSLSAAMAAGAAGAAIAGWDMWKMARKIYSKIGKGLKKSGEYAKNRDRLSEPETFDRDIAMLQNAKGPGRGVLAGSHLPGFVKTMQQLDQLSGDIGKAVNSMKGAAIFVAEGYLSYERTERARDMGLVLSGKKAADLVALKKKRDAARMGPRL